MKRNIYTKLVIDIASNAILESEAFLHLGPVNELKGSVKSTSTTVIPPPTTEENNQRALANFANIQGLQSQGYETSSTDPRLRPANAKAEAAYFAANPDVAAVYGNGANGGGLQHWLDYGKNEGRLFGGYDPTGRYITGGSDPNKYIGTAEEAAANPSLGWSPISGGMFIRKRTASDFSEDTANPWQKVGDQWIRKAPASALSPEDQQMAEIQKLYGDELLKRAQAGFGATDEEKAKIGEIYGAQRTAGKENIRQFMAELSGSRGMDINTSTPMARELARASGELETSLGAAQGASELDFGERARNFAQEMRSFQAGLQQRSMENRMNMGQGFMGMANNLAELRSQNKTTTTKGPGGGSNIGGIASGVGSAVGGIAIAF